MDGERINRRINSWVANLEHLSRNKQEVTDSINAKFSAMCTDTNPSESTERGCLLNMFSEVEGVAQARVREVQQKCEALGDTVNKKKSQVEQLNRVLQEEKAENEGILNEIENYKKKIETINQKMEGLENSRRCIKTYKLLTGANFVFGETTRTKGFIFGENGVEIFDFDNSEMSNEEQTTQLRSLLEKASKADQEKLDGKLS